MKKCFPIILFVPMMIIGCATTTKPNLSAVYKIQNIRSQLPQIPNAELKAKKDLPVQIQHLFVKLYELDPAVAIEIGKLPEFQDNIGDLQELSLNRFIELLVNASPEEKANLKEFLNVGKPEIRRYCSPLQAIIWLLEKDDFDPKISPLRYDLDTLLTKSWSLNLLSRGEDKNRWEDYHVVIDRLNDPYLIDFYEKKKFMYYYSRKAGDWSSNPYGLFKTKQGDCLDVAAFSVICLRNGGYPAWELDVGHIPDGYGSTHIVTLFEMDGEKFIMDNGRPYGMVIVPYEQYRP